MAWLILAIPSSTNECQSALLSADGLQFVIPVTDVELSPSSSASPFPIYLNSKYSGPFAVLRPALRQAKCQTPQFHRKYFITGSGHTFIPKLQIPTQINNLIPTAPTDFVFLGTTICMNTSVRLPPVCRDSRLRHLFINTSVHASNSTSAFPQYCYSNHNFCLNK